MPPLAAAKTAAAVACAAQALILGPVEQMQVAHGPRDSDGRVQVAWVSKAGLERLGQVLVQGQFRLRGLYPAPYALPVGTAAMDDGYLLTRDSLQQAGGAPAGPLPGAGCAAGGRRRNAGAAPCPAGACTRASAKRPAVAGAGRWRCVALAAVVWTVGLNLYAARQADEGQRLKALMSQQVRQAFPELPVVLNPLQQARQQLAARQSGAAADPGQRFPSLLQLAGSHLPFMVGSVERLTFEQGRLHLATAGRQPQPGGRGRVASRAGPGRVCRHPR